jgi:endoglycosylceramidase
VNEKAMTELTRLPQLSTTGKWITDTDGNVVILRGVNLVSKTSRTPEQLGFDERNAELLAKHGFSVVRLGVTWCNVQPDPRSSITGKGYDDRYLTSLERTIELLAQFGIYTLVDFHQDAYGAPWGYGAPAWAVVKGGKSNPHYGFFICTLGGDKLRLEGRNLEVQTDCDFALDAFWLNNTVEGLGLWEHYSRMQQHVATFLRGQGGNIFGYDLLNEPTTGSDWVEAYGGEGIDLSHGCRRFDKEKLAKFYEYIFPNLRRAHPEAILWFEPNVLHGLGSPTYLPVFVEKNIGFNFHNYDPGNEKATPPISSYQRPVTNALAYQEQANVPMITSEYGGEVPFESPEKYAELMEKIQGILDKSNLSYIFWAYFNNPTYPFFLPSKPSKQGIVEDMSKALLPPNVQEMKLSALTRVYPRIISGKPESFIFNPQAKTFHLEYDPILPSGQRGTSATRIVVPSPLYPHGYSVEVKGGKAVHFPGLGYLEIYADPTSSMVTVDINPCA